MLWWIDGIPSPIHDFPSSKPFALRSPNSFHQEVEFISFPLDFGLPGDLFLSIECGRMRSCLLLLSLRSFSSLCVRQLRPALWKMRGSGLSQGQRQAYTHKHLKEPSQGEQPSSQSPLTTDAWVNPHKASRTTYWNVLTLWFIIKKYISSPCLIFWHRTPKTLGIHKYLKQKIGIFCYVDEVTFGPHLRMGTGCQGKQKCEWRVVGISDL